MDYIIDKNLFISPMKREYIESDRYEAWMNNPIVCQYNSHGLFPKTKYEMEEYIRSFETGKDLVWAILVKGKDLETKKEEFNMLDVFSPGASSELAKKLCPDSHIGQVALQNINYLYRSAELALVIGEPSFWGKGIGSKVCRKVLSHGFDKLNLHRIWTGTAETNQGMKKIAERIGMRQEGIFRDGMFLHGIYRDIHTYSILEEEYRSTL